MPDEFFEFECGCKFKILDKEIKNSDGLPHLEFKFDNINFDCPKTWELFRLGKTKGVFQLETNLGRAWSKRVAPSKIEDLAALTALLRPGCLKAILDGKSMTKRYADRKSGEEEISDIDPSITDILAPTYGVLTYQEQVMAIAQKIAGFTLQEADELRKGVGKKNAKILTEVGEKFFNGCAKQNIVTKEKAEEIWSYIIKGARYLFNASHAVSYGILAYQTAYLKAHFPLNFYTGWLNLAKEKLDPQQEVRELVSDAKANDIDVCVPSLLHFDKGLDFTLINQRIYFGPRNIKRIGDAQVKKINECINDITIRINKKIQDLSWYEFLIHFTPKVNKTTVTNLALAGALDHFKLSRKEILHEYDIWSQLTPREQDIIVKLNVTNLRDGLLQLGNTKKININRTKLIDSLRLLLESPASSLQDTALWINKTEETLLGVPITCQKIDAVEDVEADSTCKEFNDGKSGEMTFCVELKDVRKHIIKKKGKQHGKEMGFLVIEDTSGVVDNIAVFPDVWEEFSHLLYPTNLVALFGYRSKENSLVINKVKQL